MLPDQAELALYRAIVARITEGVLVIRVSDRTVAWSNPRLNALLGYGERGLEGQAASAVLGAKADAVLQRGHGWAGVMTVLREDGAALRCEAAVSPFEHPEDGSVWLVICSKLAREPEPPRIGVTLPERGTWRDDLRRELGRARRSGAPVALAIFSLDGLDDLGGAAAVDALAGSTEAWRRALRDTDTIAHYEFGELDYAAVLPDCAPEIGDAVVERARAATPGGLTTSAGLAFWDRDESPVQLAARAHAALRTARRAGGDCCVLASPPSAD
ncbi:MAG TPA: hypothetical protein VHX88_21770 [Solirubrobacteraceae bacterium]|nr:hypothetical protein [Solirubrobacteraceae bacterium]